MEDNYSFGKIIFTFAIILSVCFVCIQILNEIDNSQNNTQTEYSGATKTTSNVDTGYRSEVGPTPTLYTYSIDGVKYNGTISTENNTVNVIVMNATIVGSDKDNVTLVEFMREDGIVFTRIVDTTDTQYTKIGNIVKMNADSVNIYPLMDPIRIDG